MECSNSDCANAGEMDRKGDISGFRIWQCAECKTIEVEELEAED